MKKAYRIYGIQSKEKICALWKFQGKKRVDKGTESIFKETNTQVTETCYRKMSWAFGVTGV